MNQPGIILLREGTDSSQGKAQLVSNINACQVCFGRVCVLSLPVAVDVAVAAGFDGGCCAGQPLLVFLLFFSGVSLRLWSWLPGVALPLLLASGGLECFFASHT